MGILVNNSGTLCNFDHEGYGLRNETVIFVVFLLGTIGLKTTELGKLRLI